MGNLNVTVLPFYSHTPWDVKSTKIVARQPITICRLTLKIDIIYVYVHIDTVLYKIRMHISCKKQIWKMHNCIKLQNRMY